MAENNHDVKTDSPGWPDPFRKKDEKYFQEAIDYAISHHSKRENEVKKDQRLKAKFVGWLKESAINDLQTITSHSEVKYVDYKMGYRKIMQMVGEWLQRPINATVYTVNSNTVKEKQDVILTHMGMAGAQEQTNYLRENNLANPFGGMESQYDLENDTPEDFLERLNIKQRNEHILQVILNKYIRKDKAKDQLYFNLIDLLLTSKCFSKTSIGANGKTTTRPIDSLDAIFAESLNEYFTDNSTFVGERRKMTYSEILEKWPELLDKTPKNTKKLEKIKAMFGSFYNTIHENHGTPNSDNFRDGDLYAPTYTIQLHAYEKSVKKTSKDKKGNVRTSVMSNDYYEENEGKINSERKAGRYEIDIRFRKYTYEVSRIGDVVYMDGGRIHDQILNPEDPWDVEYDYTGLLFNTVIGQRTSVQELMVELEHTYNIIRMVINRELNKFKGMNVAYDRGLLPRVNNHALTFEEIVNKMTNKGVIDYNSSADGNYAGEQKDQSNFFQPVDLGLSSSMDAIVNLGYEIEKTCDRIIGFNQERVGETPASSTVTNAQNNLINSQASTAPIVYFFNRYTEKVLHKYVEKEKIALAYYRKKEGDMLLGADATYMLREGPELIDDYMGVFVSDSQKEEFVRRTMIQRADQAVAAGEIRIQDVGKAEMAETVNEAFAILDKGWEIMKSYQASEQDRMNQAALQQNQQKGQMVTEDREDKQAHELEAIQLKAALEQRKEGLKGVSGLAQKEQEGQDKRAIAQMQSK